MSYDMWFYIIVGCMIGWVLLEVGYHIYIRVCATPTIVPVYNQISQLSMLQQHINEAQVAQNQEQTIIGILAVCDMLEAIQANLDQQSIPITMSQLASMVSWDEMPEAFNTLRGIQTAFNELKLVNSVESKEIITAKTAVLVGVISQYLDSYYLGITIDDIIKFNISSKKAFMYGYRTDK